MHLLGRDAEVPSAEVGLTPRALSVTLIAALSGCLLVTILLAGWRDYEASRAKAAVQATGAARLLETELRWLVGSTDLVLRHAAAQAGAGPEHLRDLAALLPVAGSLGLYAPDGTPLHGSDFDGAADRFQPDPGFLAALRRGGADLYVGAVGQQSTGSGQLVVARVLRDAEGRVRLFAEARLAPAAMDHVVRGIDLGTDAMLGVIRADGGMVFRRPEADLARASEQARNAPLFQEHLDRPEGVYEAASVVDGVERIFAYRRLSDLGLIVVAGPTRARSLADMRTRLDRLATFGAPPLMILLALMILAARSVTKAAAARAAARAAVRAKLHFISGTYHDLGQILLALDLFLTRLRETATDAQLPAVEGADAAVRSAHDLLDTIMDASQLASGGVRVHVAEVHVRDLLERIALEVGPRAAQKGLRLSVRGADLVALSDPHLLERIVRNLVVNAIKFTSVGGVLLACRRVGGQVSVEVWDSGPGIPEAEHKAIFTAFHRVGRPLPARGMGLGLSIVDQFATLLGHVISLSSRVGRGSVFKLRLPTAGRRTVT